MSDTILFDLPTLLELRRAVRDLDPARPPTVRVIARPAGAPARRQAFLPGSFNPPTNAHLALAASALAAGQVDALDYLIATRTVDKEKVDGATLADRLALLSEIARARANEGVVLVNRGLYVDQAELLRRAQPEIEELWFVVGFDKILQIFEPRYYADRDAALTRLFALARFLVAPRGTADAGDLAALLNEPRNRPFASAVQPLPLAPEYRALSSSRLRAAAHRGDPHLDVPAVVDQFIHETGAYAAPLRDAAGAAIDRYAWRERLLGLVEQGALPVLSRTEFQVLVQRVVDPSWPGHDRRERIAHGDLLAITDLLSERHTP